MANWRESPTGLIVRLYGVLAVLALYITSRMSRPVFVTTAIVVAVVSVVFVICLIKLRRHFARYPMRPEPRD